MKIRKIVDDSALTERASASPKRGNLLHTCHRFGVRARFVNVWSN